MKLIKLALVSIVALFAVASFIGALLPSTVLVSRAVSMHVSKDSVTGYLSDINRWKQWIEGMESAGVQVYSSSKANIGGTIVEITQVTDTTILSSWKGKNGGDQTSMMRLITDSLHKEMVVQWQFEQKLKWYPWEKLGSMMNDKILGTMMEKNLNSLKLLAEKK